MLPRLCQIFIIVVFVERPLNDGCFARVYGVKEIASLDEHFVNRRCSSSSVLLKSCQWLILKDCVAEFVSKVDIVTFYC